MPRSWTANPVLHSINNSTRSAISAVSLKSVEAMLRGFARSCGRQGTNGLRNKHKQIPRAMRYASQRREAIAKSLTVMAGSRMASVLAQAAAELEIVSDEDEDATRLL